MDNHQDKIIRTYDLVQDKSTFLALYLKTPAKNPRTWKEIFLCELI